MKKILITLLIASITFFFGRALSTMATEPTNPINPSTVTRGNVFVQVWGRDGSSNRWVGCVIRPDTNGTWYIIGGGHQNMGCTAISQDSGGVTVSFATYDKIVTTSFDADEEMVIDGYAVGASVGFSNAYIQIGL